MPDINAGNFASSYLTEINRVLDETKQKAALLGKTLDGLKDNQQYGNLQKVAVDQVSDVLSSFTPNVPNTFSNLVSMTLGEASLTLEGFQEDDTPITRDALAAIDEWLPSNTLHQPSYLKLFEFAQAANAVYREKDEDPINLNAKDFMYVSPDDMHVRTILTRTVIYMQELRARDEADFFYVTCRVGESTVLQLESAHCTLLELQAALQSDELQAAAIRCLSEPGFAKNYEMSIALMLQALDKVLAQLQEALTVVAYYNNLCDALRETNETISAAYQIYRDRQCITF